jgi:ABC-type Fe3+-citrate transport system substrate-binding protein
VQLNIIIVQVAHLHGKAAAASHLLRKHALDRIVPAIVALKTTLEEKRHPLQRHAVQCLVQLMLEHKDAMEEALAMHRQLAAEIKFALTQQQKAAKVTQQQPPQPQQQRQGAPATPGLGQTEPSAPGAPFL